MTDAILIANPAASQFTGALHRTIMTVLGRHHTVAALWPQSGSEARTMAAEATQRGAQLVVAVGGDGIVHQVAQSLVGTQTALGIIPAGTTNVLARILNIPSKPAAAAKLLGRSEQPPVRCPVVKITADTPGGPMRCWGLFSVGVGPDAAIVLKAEQEPYRKYRFGSIHYARTAIGTVWSDIRRRPPTATVTVGGSVRPAIGMMVQFQPVYTYFGRVPLRLAPGIPDPMSVLTIEALPLRRAGRVLRAAVGSAGLGDVKGLHVTPAVDAVEISSPAPLEFQADGELLGSATRVRVSRGDDFVLVAGGHSPR